MNDQEYIQEYVKAAQLIFSSLTQDLVSIISSELRFLTMTNRMLEFMGLEYLDQIIGKTFAEIKDLLPFDQDITKQFEAQNLEVMSTRKNKVFLEVAPAYNNEIRIYKSFKTPIINPHTNNCLGIRVQITKMYWPSAIKALFKMHECKGLLEGRSKTSNPLAVYPLNELQHMVLYLCIGNYSYSDISLFMNEFGQNITPSRVNDILEQLKVIFNVGTKPQLIEKAIGLNFHTLLPNGLFRHVASIDITDESAKIIINK